jgi:hypothetical protein
MEKLTAGTIAGNGTFRCDECGAVGPLARTADVPACPQCGSTHVTRASLFSAGPRFERAPDATVHGTLSLPGSDEVVAAAREMAPEAGRYLAYLDGADLRLVSLDSGQVRIGRSLTADLRFDDPTVSRRHALVVTQTDGVKVMDDRSLNGVFVGGERIEWRMLRDGDEIVIGRHTLHFVDTAPRPARDAVSPAAETA